MCSRASAMKALPAQIRHSLLASAMSLPERIAAAVARSPAAPTIAESTMSTGSAAASSIAATPAAAAMPDPKRSSRSAVRPASSATTARRAPKLAGRLARAWRRSSRAVTACTSKRSGAAAMTSAALVADRAGRAEQRDPLPHDALPAIGTALPGRARVHASEAEHGNQPGERSGAEEPIDPIEHAAMAGNDRVRNPSRQTAA